MSQSPKDPNHLVHALLKDAELLGVNLTNTSIPSLVAREDVAMADHMVARQNNIELRSQKLKEANRRKSAEAKSKTSNSKSEAETKAREKLLNEAADILEKEKKTPAKPKRKRTTSK